MPIMADTATTAGPSAAVDTARPYWLTGPCPAWCSGSHDVDDAPVDRVHYPDWTASVDLSLMEFTPEEIERQRTYKAAVETAVFVPFVSVNVSQNVLEATPRISVDFMDDPTRGGDFTPDEARALMARLGEALALVDGDTTQVTEAGV